MPVLPERIGTTFRAALLLSWLPVTPMAQVPPSPAPARPPGQDSAPRTDRAPAAGGILVPPAGALPPMATDPGIVAPTPEPPERTMPLVLPPGGPENPTRPR